MYDSGRDTGPNALKNPGGSTSSRTKSFFQDGVWLYGGGPGTLARPLSPDTLAASHPLWAADVARLAPWREVLLGEDAGPAAGTWYVSEALRTISPICILGECDSSLDAAWKLDEAALLPPFSSVLAVNQRQGRGQLRREWSSPAGNIYAAWLLPEAPDEQIASMAPVLVGACLADALVEKGFPASVKWPNDLLLDGSKVGGILLEERNGHTIAGIGLNCASAPDAADLRRDHAIVATLLQAFGSVPGTITLWVGLVQSGQTCYRHSVMLSDTAERTRLASRHMAWIGRNVLVRDAETDGFVARIIGLAEDGGLRLRRVDPLPGQELTLHCGSISLL